MVLDRVRIPLSSDEAFQETDAEKEARIEKVNGNYANNTHDSQSGKRKRHLCGF